MHWQHKRATRAAPPEISARDHDHVPGFAARCNALRDQTKRNTMCNGVCVCAWLYVYNRKWALNRLYRRPKLARAVCKVCGWAGQQACSWLYHVFAAAGIAQRTRAATTHSHTHAGGEAADAAADDDDNDDETEAHCVQRYYAVIVYPWSSVHQCTRAGARVCAVTGVELIGEFNSLKR